MNILVVRLGRPRTPLYFTSQDTDHIDNIPTGSKCWAKFPIWLNHCFEYIAKKCSCSGATPKYEFRPPRECLIHDRVRRFERRNTRLCESSFFATYSLPDNGIQVRSTQLPRLSWDCRHLYIFTKTAQSIRYKQEQIYQWILNRSETRTQTITPCWGNPSLNSIRSSTYSSRTWAS